MYHLLELLLEDATEDPFKPSRFILSPAPIYEYIGGFERQYHTSGTKK